MEGTPIDFLVDTGAQYLVLLEPQGKLARKTSWVQGAIGMKQYQWTTRRSVDLGAGRVSHSFMVIPECPFPLLGRDLLTKMGAQIHFLLGETKILDQSGRQIQVLTIQLEDEYRLHQKPIPLPVDIRKWLDEFPEAWVETGGTGFAEHHPPVCVDLKPGADPIWVQQYPMTLEARQGITPHIHRLLAQKILRPYQLAWNTPLLPVKKPNPHDYRPVQDLREVNR